MSNERRRYFRIDETVGISYEVIDPENKEQKRKAVHSDVLDLVFQQDQQIEKLLNELADESPKVAQLVGLFNQKLERIVQQLIMDSHLVGKIANRVQEANISACGMAFENTESIPLDTHLRLELTLYPSKKHIFSEAVVVACDEAPKGWYWRVDFCGMSNRSQEELIQHIVQSQSAQLKSKRDL